MTANEIVRVERWCYSHMGVFGTLSVGDFQCFTVERPWLDNAPNVSCIPSGFYQMKLGRYNRGNEGRGYPAYEIQGVEGRSLIKLHRANVMLEVRGCLGLGQSLGWYKSHWAVLSSKVTVDAFMGAMQAAPAASIRIIDQIRSP